MLGIASGKLERTSALAAITSESGRVVYTLKSRPQDLDAIAALLPGAAMSWNEATSSLTAEFDSSTPPEAANSVFVPALLDFGLVSITTGRTLEQVYLQGLKK